MHAVGYAFPSGHATFAAAGWLAVAILLAGAWPARRRALVAAALAVIAIVGASRVYLQVHWTTDVARRLAARRAVADDRARRRQAWTRSSAISPSYEGADNRHAE